MAYCVVCNNKLECTIIDGESVCKDTECWDQPTCRELFTGAYNCDLCGIARQVALTQCHLFYHESNERLYKYACAVCLEGAGINMGPQRRPWHTITESVLLRQIQAIYDRRQQTAAAPDGRFSMCS